MSITYQRCFLNEASSRRATQTNHGVPAFHSLVAVPHDLHSCRIPILAALSYTGSEIAKSFLKGQDRQDRLFDNLQTKSLARLALSGRSKQVYGLIHLRWIYTTPSLNPMTIKSFKKRQFGTCPRCVDINKSPADKVFDSSLLVKWTRVSRGGKWR